MKRKLNEDDVPMPTPQEEVKPNPPPNFENLGLDARLLQAIAKESFTRPTPVQAQAIPLILEGRDVLGRNNPDSIDMRIQLTL